MPYLHTPGLPWSALVCPGLPRSALVWPGLPCSALVCPGLPRSALICTGLPWSFIPARSAEQGLWHPVGPSMGHAGNDSPDESGSKRERHREERPMPNPPMAGDIRRMNLHMYQEIAK